MCIWGNILEKNEEDITDNLTHTHTQSNSIYGDSGVKDRSKIKCVPCRK